MGISENGEPQCDSCPARFGGSVELSLSFGWGYWKGQTGGGSTAEHVICRDCRTTGRKRPLQPARTYEDEPLF